MVCKPTKLQASCGLQCLVGVDSLMLCTAESLKTRGITCGLIYEDDRRSFFCGFGSRSPMREEALKRRQSHDFMRF